MPRRKQDCPKRRDFDDQDEPEVAKTASNQDSEFSKQVEKTEPQVDAAPLDLSTKPKKPATGKRTFTDYSIANNLKPPEKTPKLEPSSIPNLLTAMQIPMYPEVQASCFLSSLGLPGSAFAFPPVSSITNISPLRLPTCSAADSIPANAKNPAPLIPKSEIKPKSTFDSLNALSSLVQTVGTKSSSRTSQSSGSIQELDESGGTSPSCSGKKEESGPANGNGSMTMQDLWWKYMKKEESAEIKRVNEAKQIFTCLQCHQSFQSMDQLVKHMEVTQHFTNVPKHYSWSLQYARQKMRQMKLKLKYSERMMYFCHLCGAPFTVAVHQHFAEVHDMHNPVDNMNFVQIVMVNSNGAPRLASPSDNSSLSAIDQRTPTPNSLTDSSPSSSPSHSVKSTGHDVVRKALKSPGQIKQEEPTSKKVKHEGPTTDEATGNLLKKMELLVKNAVDQTYEKGKKSQSSTAGLESVHPLPLSKAFIKQHKLILGQRSL